MSDNNDPKKDVNEDENVDHLDAGFLGNHLKASGPSISKLWPFVGWSMIIGVSALSLAHLLRTFLVNWK